MRVAPEARRAWVLRIDGAADGPTNMARDHALVRRSGPDGGFLRLYRWDPPTLSLGRNEPGVGRYDVAEARTRGIGIVRRPTGGRAVLHAREVTYALAAPIRFFGGPRVAHRSINEALVRGLTRLGVEVTLAGPDADVRRTTRLDLGACFRTPAPGEIVAGGRKLVGSAQVRVGDALLQHGSILLEDDQGLVDALSGAGRPAVRCRVEGSASLAGLLGHTPDPARVCEAVAEGFRETLGGSWTRCVEDIELPPDLLERYRSPEWTWRR